MKIEVAEFEKQFASTDFTNRDAVVALFPEYKRLQLASRKTLSKAVKIEGFTMKTPFGDKVLLDNADLIIEAGRRQSLVGPNCCGKTLLFHNIVNGEIPDFPRHLHVHHCKELEGEELSQTVLDSVVKSNHYLNVLSRIEAHIRKLLTDPSLSPADKSNLTNNVDFIVSQVNALDGYRAKEKASKMLKVLGFDETGQAKLVSSLSGGLRMRVALCMAFFIEADLLLLDEPTNHLDFPSVLWLENRLRGYKGSFLMVSHDRELLKNVCMSVLLMEDKKIHYYHMSFDMFEKKKAAEDKARFEEIEKFLARNKNPSPTSPIGRMVLDKRDWYKSYHQKQVALATKFTFPGSTPLTPAPGDTTPAEEMTLLNLENVRFSYDPSTGHFIFNDPISFVVKANTRIGVMGPNGAGKSTLLKLLTKKLIPTEGSLYTHPEYKLAYFGQHSTAELDLELTAFDFMTNSFPGATSANLRNHLSKTGIIGDVADTRMKGLSYSQRSCIVFAKLTFAGPHLLILDEPTNFLDLESVDSLIGACNKYKGALLLVSHNRDFLKKCAKQYLSVVPGQFLLYDDIKSAERGTYSFISDLEDGGKVGKEALQNTPGGGTVHASQKVGAAAAPAVAPKPATTSVSAPTLTSQPAKAVVVAAQTPAPAVAEKLAYIVGEKVQAKFKDGKWYPAVVKGCKANSVTVFYTGYGNTEVQALTTVRAIKKSD